MNALQSYSSDDESDEEPVIKKMNKAADPGTNYDDVGMDISEESGDDADSGGSLERSAPRSTNSTTHSNSNAKKDGTSILTSEAGREKVLQGSETTNEKDKKVSVGLDKSKGRISEEKSKDSRHTSHKKKRSKSRERNNRSRSRERYNRSKSRERYNRSKSRERNNKSESKERTNRSGSKDRNNRSRSKEKSTRSKSKERNNRSKSRDKSNRDADRLTRDRKDYRDSRKSSDSKDSRDYRRRSGRRSRSRSRDRRRSRSRSRSRDRDRRKRRTRSRSRSRSRDRKRPHEIRREAQQKLAAFKASNPNFDHNEMLKKGMEAQFAEVQKTTGVALPTYYNPAVMNPIKIAEQERKKKLLWGNKNKVEPTVCPEAGAGNAETLWNNTKFSNDSDGKMAEKFKRLMGVRAAGGGPSTSVTSISSPTSQVEGTEILEKQETLFNSMEKQYEVARLATHTQRGYGLGFSSQSYLPK